jgi:peptidoglycan/xylan/chitin deacetylase (PgdA/CDA1 family)
MSHPISRRQFLASSATAGASLLPGNAFGAADSKGNARPNQALVAITLDLEMSRNFPTWETTHWDYEKGNLNEETKRYAVEACRRVKAHGGVLHCFCVGRVLEQENVDWLKGIAAEGHPVGNHTYNHVNVRATEPKKTQYRFERAPWLIEGKTPRLVIAEDVRITTAALKSRAGITAAGFRTPGGFSNGLEDRPDVRQLLQEQGFTWVSSKYPSHQYGEAGKRPGKDVYESVVKAQPYAQPFVYPQGLIEVPMSPISDIGAFRTGRWKLDWFLEAIRLGVEWAIAHGAAFDFLSHPSCLYVVDPEFKAIELICDLVGKAGDKAAIVDLGTIARRAKGRTEGQNP